MPNKLELACQQSKIIAIDTETNFTENHHDRFLVGISICTESEETFYIPVGHRLEKFLPFEDLEVNLGNWIEILERALAGDHEWIFHNAKFDITVLEMAGFKLPAGDIWKLSLSLIC